MATSSRLEVFLSLGVAVVSLHGLLSGFPLSRADFTEDISVLEGLDQSEVFINISADWGVVDGKVSEDTLIIDDVGGSEGDTFAGDEAAIRSRDILSDISNEGDLHFTKTSFISGLLAPFHMGEFGVNGDTQDFAVKFLEFAREFRELDDFSGANEGEVQRIEEEDDVLASVVGELDLLEALSVDVSVSFEIGSLGEDGRSDVLLHLGY